MIVAHQKKYPNNISLLQLTGATTNASSFKGLVLGDPKSKVIRILGEPDKIEQILSPKVAKLIYNKRNYSVELDENQRLYSIQIYTTIELMRDTDDSDKDWDRFRSAVLSKNLSIIIEMMKPDVEIYRNATIISITTPFGAFANNPDSNFVSVLVGPTNSVLQQLSQVEPSKEYRLTDNLGVGIVYKFPNGKILREIALFPFNGRFRVYEIAFQKNTK